MKRRWLIIYSILIMCIIIILTCTVDHGLKPERYILSGTVEFLRGDAPENTDWIRVYALKEFPPNDPQNFLYLGESGSLDYKSGNKIPFEIQVSPTTYDAIVLIWKEKGYDINLTGLIGIYTTLENYPLPLPVEVSKDKPVADDIVIYSDWSKVAKDASIAGTIHYSGEWPEDTQILLLAAYRIKPSDATGLLFFENVDYTQPLNVDSSKYRLLVSKGTYSYIVLYWVGNNISGLDDLLPIGVYEHPDNPGEPGTVVLPAETDTTNIDIHVDFDSLTFP